MRDGVRKMAKRRQSPARSIADALAVARAAGWDAGNRSAAAHGSASWNDEDWDAACETTRQILATTAGATAPEAA